jgi:predicted NBD/HSP70 family sugar kinase
MKEKLRFLGLDVHAETIAVAVAETDGEVRSRGTIPNRAEAIRKMIKKLGPAEKLRAFTKQVRRAMSSTGSWRSWAFSVRLWPPRWCRSRRVIG